MQSPTSPESERGLKELAGIFTYWKTVVGPLSGLIAMLPLGTLFTKSILPPGLEELAPAAAIISSVALLIGLYYILRDSSEATIRRWAIALFTAGFVAIVVYLFLSVFTIVEHDGERHLISLTKTEEAEGLIDAGLVGGGTPSELLDTVGRDSEDRVWKHRSWIKFFFLVSFSGIFMGWSASFFLFTLRCIVIDRARSVPIAAGPVISETHLG